MLYSGGMSKTITIRVSEEAYDRYRARAEAEGTTVTTLVTEAVERDPRLDHGGVEATQGFMARYAAEFAAAFPEEEPDSAHPTADGQAA